MSKDKLRFVVNHVFSQYLANSNVSDEKKEEVKEVWKEIKKII